LLPYEIHLKGGDAGAPKGAGGLLGEYVSCLKTTLDSSKALI
jgi:hypothetical protein